MEHLEARASLPAAGRAGRGVIRTTRAGNPAKQGKGVTMIERRVWAGCVAAVLVMSAAGGCASSRRANRQAGLGAGFLGVAGMAAAAGDSDAAAAILQEGTNVMLQEEAAEAGSMDMAETEAPASAGATGAGALPPLRPCSGQRDCYMAALEQYRAAGRGNSPEARQLEKQIRELDSQTPVFRK